MQDIIIIHIVSKVRHLQCVTFNPTMADHTPHLQRLTGPQAAQTGQAEHDLDGYSLASLLKRTVYPVIPNDESNPLGDKRGYQASIPITENNLPHRDNHLRHLLPGLFMLRDQNDNNSHPENSLHRIAFFLFIA